MRTNKFRKNRRKDSPEAKRAKRIARLVRFFKVVAIFASVAAMSLLFIFGHDFLTQCDYFEAKRIEVEGVSWLTRDHVREYAGLEGGMNILSINLSVTRKKLLAHPWIKTASVARRFPDKILIHIEEHEPLAVLDLGADFLMNKSGEIFKAREPADPDGLPMVSGLGFSDLKTPEEDGSVLYASVMEVLRLGCRADSILPNDMIGRIDVDPNLGLSLRTVAGKKVVRLGFENYPGKYAMLRRLMAHMEADELFVDYNSIDLTNPDSIVVLPVVFGDDTADKQRTASRSKEA